MDSDDDLARRAAQGDGAAFLALVEQHATPLQLFIRRRSGGLIGADCDAEDLLQATLCKAWELAGTFAPGEPGSFYRWLVGIAVNQIGNRVHYLNAKGRRDVRPIPSAGPDASAFPIPDSLTSITTQAARREAIARAERALAEMPADEREIVELTYLEGLTIRAAAERAGMPRSTAFRALHAGMERLRRALAPQAGIDPLDPAAN
ncbi:MAG TPA: RNA polymerase sigma factor [Planctomycetota bacterium]|nr:RNA polymerase sigma factor [Planctomycetota bacterium]